MPALSPEERQVLLGPRGYCHWCRAPRLRHYCRSCDEFLDCCLCPEGLAFRGHDDHRLYIWTPDGVIAQPNFDEL